ncbi:MAG TPA: hypothetical protein PKN52_03670 [Trueperaceae bacterium]|nr:hypothetical protein [Trueperaceae bacterium]
MSTDAASAMKSRLRSDLRVAMKDGRADAVRLIRTLVAALDNAEAPPPPGRRSTELDNLETSPVEVERLLLDAAQVRAVLEAEFQERERAAEEMSLLNQPERAGALRAEMLLIGRYLG